MITGTIAPLAIFLTFLKLGLTSFGGPVAHIGYFRTVFVEREKWLDATEFADLVSLCQFLPGPASSQLGFAVGYHRGGMAGAFLAFLGFTLPSALLLIAFGYGLTTFDTAHLTGVIAGLKLVAVSIVAHALYGMATSLCFDLRTRVIGSMSLVALLVWGGVFGQLAIIVAGGFCGYFFCTDRAQKPALRTERWQVGIKTVLYVGLFLFLLLVVPFIGQTSGLMWIGQFSGYFQSGALVFGGGHVVLPLLEASAVEPGWMTKEQFLAGYGAAQAVPGPLFTIAAFMGTVTTGAGLLTGWAGALLATTAIFLPGFLLLLAFLPHWQRLRENQTMRAVLTGVNAAVAGLLGAAFIDPVFISSIEGTLHLVLATGGFVALIRYQVSPLYVVLFMSGAGYIFL